MKCYWLKAVSNAVIFAIFLLMFGVAYGQALCDVILGGEIIFDEDIVVYADNIKIRAQTPITLKNESTLYLIANNVINIGRFSKIYSTGKKGSKGENGRKLRTPSQKCRRGTNGTNGRQGFCGENSGTIVFIAKKITYDEPIYIRLDGGLGGDGGDGGKGGSG